MTDEAADFEITIFGLGDSDHRTAWFRVGESPIKRRRRQRPLRPPVPGGLLTAVQAAAKLSCSVKTLNGHVAGGALKYVTVGHGTKRLRKMFTDADLNQFIADQTREAPPCPFDATRARRSGNTISKSEVVAFSALQRRRRGAKPKQ
jgi:hypothetical protein